MEGMALLDAANTGAYGHPEMTRVNIGVGTRPGILFPDMISVIWKCC